MSNKKNWVGLQFGKLTVTEETDDKNKVICKCDCGSDLRLYSKTNLGRCTFSCGCKNKNNYRDKRKVNIFGKTFGILKAIGEFTENGLIYITCKCGCGNIKNVEVWKLTSGNTRSCGCISGYLKSVSRIKPLEDKLVKCVANSSKRTAIVKKFEYSLNENVIKKLIFKPCYYCGDIGNIYTVRRKLDYGKTIKYNGLDRLDNNIGYTISNVVPCCAKCNSAKSNSSQSDFLNWVNKFVEFQNACN